MKRHKENTAESRQREHKCHNCTWSRWSDVESVICMFSHCFKEIEKIRYRKKGAE